jgi:hypothetical protein
LAPPPISQSGRLVPSEVGVIPSENHALQAVGVSKNQPGNNADALALEIENDALQFEHLDGVDAGKGLVEQQAGFLPQFHLRPRAGANAAAPG